MFVMAGPDLSAVGSWEAVSLTVEMNLGGDHMERRRTEPGVPVSMATRIFDIVGDGEQGVRSGETW